MHIWSYSRTLYFFLWEETFIFYILDKRPQATNYKSIVFYLLCKYFWFTAQLVYYEIVSSSTFFQPFSFLTGPVPVPFKNQNKKLFKSYTLVVIIFFFYCYHTVNSLFNIIVYIC